MVFVRIQVNYDYGVVNVNIIAVQYIAHHPLTHIHCNKQGILTVLSSQGGLNLLVRYEYQVMRTVLYLLGHKLSRNIMRTCDSSTVLMTCNFHCFFNENRGSMS